MLILINTKDISNFAPMAAWKLVSHALEFYSKFSVKPKF